MSPRVGMIVALVAAVLLAISIATNAWFSGHPTLDGKRFDRKTANIGLLTANQCNYTDDEESDCKHLALGGSFAITRYVELGFTGILTLSLLLFAVTRRKGFAKIVLVAAAAAAVMSIVLLISGPDLKTGGVNSMPLGYGFFLFFGGTALAIGSGVLAMLPQGAPTPRFLAPLPTQQPRPSQPGGFDVHALLAEDSLRPSVVHGPEPMMGRPQSPGGALPGPGPLIPPSGSNQPLFQSAPQLRPLYEATGGAGFTPPSQPVQFPTRGPTPMGHAAVSAALGLDTPPPVVAPPAPKLPPPPTRTKMMSAAPPIPAIPARRPPPPMTRPPPPSSPTKMSAAVPPPQMPVVPPPQMPRAMTEDPADLLQTADFEKSLGTGDNTDANALPFDSATAENETKAFQSEESTDVGPIDEDLETAARDKIDSTDESPPAPREPHARGSVTEVEFSGRPSVSKTDVELEPAPRDSSSVISSATPPSPRLPMSTASQSLPPPVEGAATAGPSPACPQCEAPMAWVEEHLRFYCKSCRMYF